MKSLGFKQGQSTPCAFWHPVRDIRTTLHGDNFASLASRPDLDWLAKELDKDWTVKVEGYFGPPGEPDCVHKIRTLNRLLTWTHEGIEWEADPRHVQILIREMGLKASKAGGSLTSDSKGGRVTTPGVRERPEDGMLEEVPIPVEERTRYRSLCMRTAYIGQDRPELGVAIREVAKGMQTPSERHSAQLKRTTRFLKSFPRLVQLFRNQERASSLDGWCDADHAGCLRTRKSTTGGLVMCGKHTLLHWCRGQAVIALSSGEAEYYSLVTLVSELCGIRSLALDWNLNYKLTTNVDATAAIGIASRRGLGKLKHVDTVFLWIQERIESLKITVHKKHTTEMLADILTKFVTNKDLVRHLMTMGFVFRDGEHKLTLTA